jgi:hypothetical protein
VDVVFQTERMELKAFIGGSAGTLTLNKDFKHDKEDYVSQKTLILKWTDVNVK